MQVGGKNVFEAKAGQEAVIMLPPKAPKLEKGLPVYLASSGRVKGAYGYDRPKPGEFRQRLPLDVRVTIGADKVTAAAAGFSVVLAGEFLPAKDAAKAEDTVRGAFAKTGDTPFELAALTLENPHGFFVPVSLLNALRRDLYAEIKTEEKTTVLPPTGRPIAAEKSGWIIRTDDIDALAGIDLNEVDEVTVLLSPEFDAERLKTLPKNKLRLALPALERASAKYAEPVRRLLEGGFRKWEIGNWWDCLNNMRALAENAPLPAVMPVYQDAPLFTSAVCIRANPCKSCPRGEKWLKLRHEGREYLALSKNCQTMLFAGRPLCFAAEAEKVPAAFYRVDFVYRRYSPEAAASVWKKVRAFEDVPGCAKGNLVSGGNF